MEEMIYKKPIADRDERISVLEEENEELQNNLPILREELKKATKQLEVEQKDKAKKESRVSRAINITEHRISEAIKSVIYHQSKGGQEQLF